MKIDSVRFCKIIEQGAFEKEGQSLTLKVYIFGEVGLNNVRIEGKHQKFNMFEG